MSGGLAVLLDDGARRYVWGAGGLAYTVDKSSGAVTTYHTDGLGSVRALTDSTGNVVQTYGSDAWGVPLSRQTLGSSSQPMKYTGEQVDSTGLVYLRARMYDPMVGRFLQRDAVPGLLLDPLSQNRFSYVRNNPASLTDPSGFLPAVPIDTTQLNVGSQVVKGPASGDGNRRANPADTDCFTTSGGQVGGYLQPGGLHRKAGATPRHRTPTTFKWSRRHIGSRGRDPAWGRRGR